MPWDSSVDMSNVSVSNEDKEAGSPKAGDMIARNPKNHADQWLVAEAYFKDNLEIVTPLEAELSKAGSGMTFGQALHYLKQGYKVARAGWNGKGMFVFLQNEVRDYEFHDNLDGFTVQEDHGEDTTYTDYIDTDAYFVMKTAKNTAQPGWLASQADMLAEDWQLVY